MSVRQRTPSQLSASAPDASVWVSANAGTGKTGVLVDRISRLLLSGVHPERIFVPDVYQSSGCGNGKPIERSTQFMVCDGTRRIRTGTPRIRGSAY